MPNTNDSVLHAVAATVWAIHPDKGRAILELVRIRARGGRVPAAEIRRVVAQSKQSNGPALVKGGMIAVLPVYGVIAPRMNLLTQMSGGVSAEKLGTDISTLAADPNVSTIVLDVDSPGGAATGVPELAAKIRAAAAKKQVVAVTNHMAASAAYWLASQATEVVCTPSGEVGSVGVYMMHFDESQAFADAGIRPTVVRAGKYKAEGNPFEPLGSDARGEMQRVVNDWHTRFISDVAKGRGTSQNDVRENYGGGRTVFARDALRAGMIDRIGTLDDVIADLRTRASVNQERQRAHALVAMCRENGESDATADLLIASGMSVERARLELWTLRQKRWD